MSEEEKKILELLNMANVIMGCILDDKQANIILNLIDRLQKENKELKEELDYYKQKESQEFDERDYYEE